MFKEILIFTGSFVSFLGLAGIISVAIISIKIRKEETKNLSDKKNSQSIFQNLIAVNYAALLTSFIGLIIVIVGLTII